MKDINLATTGERTNLPKYSNIVSSYQDALQVVDEVILKNYIYNLSKLDVLPLNPDAFDEIGIDDVYFFKINEMVYEKEEFTPYKFASVFNSIASNKASIIVLIDCDGVRTDFYIGIRSLEKDITTSSLRKTLNNTMSGHFPGTKTEICTNENMRKVLDNVKSTSISSVSSVANSKDAKLNRNESFVQGLEKLVLSMNGSRYTAIMIANTTDQNQLRKLRKGYETVYTQLSPFAAMQMNYGQTSSIGQNLSTTTGTNESTSQTYSESFTDSVAKTKSETDTHSTSSENTASKIVKGVAVASSMITSAFSPIIGNGIGPVAGGLFGIGVSKTESNSKSSSTSHTRNQSQTQTLGSSKTKGLSHSYTYGSNISEGMSNAMTLTAHDKSVENMLIRIDKQLKRIDEFESLGMYEFAAYFLSEDQSTSEMAASTYKALISGEHSGVEVATINSWGRFEEDKTNLIGKYIRNFIHPVFQYNSRLGSLEVTPSLMVSGNELSIHMGMPNKSVCGLPVIEHADFGKEVVRYDGDIAYGGINLGKLYNMGTSSRNSVNLDKNSMAMHTFVSGSTGSGKSNTVYELIRQCNNLGASFMVIEPAKGEYKHVFGNRVDVKVFGTNPQYADILRINPFKFSKGIHVLEHIDRLIEIFNVCWPMYAAMPAVLKEALLKSYEDCGWEFSTSKNLWDEELFPTFIDLQESLVDVINSSAYSHEVKSNYMGSLVTRIKSLTNGLNGQIFTANEINNAILFDSNVVIDLSRIGSLETKSLIMGLLIMRMSEYRMTNASAMNAPFKHLTVLEEAHNILKRSSNEQNLESPSVSGKSVEMISNAIAEMRTYGEGFVIVDQSPTAVDISAIRNTNTKIIMRLPDESDRRLVGKSAGLRDNQLDEIAKLPKGVAVVYQNDWVEPVLCEIQKYRGGESKYHYEAVQHFDRATKRMKSNFLGFLLQKRVEKTIALDIQAIKDDLRLAEISSRSKIIIKEILLEFEQNNKLKLWNDNNFEALSSVVSWVLNSKVWLKTVIDTSSDFDMLTERLKIEICNQVSGLSLEYIIAISQCLMRSMVAESDEYKVIYSAWITDFRNKRGGVYGDGV